MPRWLTVAVSRLALLALGVALALLLGEALLQAGAATIRWTGRDRPAGAATRGQRIVALGDSNTYGIYVEPDEPYPQVLAGLLAEAAGGTPAEVLNLGYPGNSSSHVRAALPHVVRELRPDVVLVMVGANDWWAEPAPAGGDGGAPPPPGWWSRSRVVRLLGMLRRSLAPLPAVSFVRHGHDGREAAFGEIAVGDSVFPWRWHRRSDADRKGHWSGPLEENLRAIAAAGRALGVEVVFLTYPADARTYGAANAVIRAAAAAAGAPLIDLGDRFRTLCPVPPCPELFYGDHHPRAPGYRLAAEQIRAWLRDRR